MLTDRPGRWLETRLIIDTYGGLLVNAMDRFEILNRGRSTKIDQVSSDADISRPMSLARCDQGEGVLDRYAFAKGFDEASAALVGQRRPRK